MTLRTFPRYDPGGLEGVGDRAVVIGASVAGLLAARVLADGFERVTVIDRDPLVDEPVARRGVPQSMQVHALMEAGRATIEDLLPGFGEDVLSDGGLLLDFGTDLRNFVDDDFLAFTRTRNPFYSATRPLFEQVLRRHVGDLDNVEVRGGYQFLEFLVEDASAVEGVRVRGHGVGGTTAVAADLVVDATGRTSRTPAWLAAHGFPSPPVDEVTVDVAYSTAVVERPRRDRRAYIVPPNAPTTRGGAVFPVEGDRWLVNLIGVHGDSPPTDAAAFAAFAESLPIPDVAQIYARHALADEEIYHYPFPTSRRHRYESLSDFPDGLIVVGDAVASFNPIYGQGMSVAALEALALHHVLAVDGLDRLGPRFFERAEPVVDGAWTLAVGSDFEFPQTTGPKPRGTDLVNRYTSRLMHRAQDDATLAAALIAVINMTVPPETLFRPSVIWRVLGPT